jgi:hypothetical protein
MSEEPVPFGEACPPIRRPDKLAVLTRCMVAANYGDLVVGYGALATEAEIRLVRQIGRLVQKALKLDGVATSPPGRLHPEDAPLPTDRAGN